MTKKAKLGTFAFIVGIYASLFAVANCAVGKQIGKDALDFAGQELCLIAHAELEEKDALLACAISDGAADWAKKILFETKKANAKAVAASAKVSACPMADAGASDAGAIDAGKDAAKDAK